MTCSTTDYLMFLRWCVNAKNLKQPFAIEVKELKYKLNYFIYWHKSEKEKAKLN